MTDSARICKGCDSTAFQNPPGCINKMCSRHLEDACEHCHKFDCHTCDRPLCERCVLENNHECDECIMSPPVFEDKSW